MSSHPATPVLWLLLQLAAPAWGLINQRAAPSSRRTLIVAAATSLPARPSDASAQVDPAQTILTGWDATRQQKLAKMTEEGKAKAALCAGRMPNELELSPFDMTWDPPCDISGYYELIAIAGILTSLKAGQVIEEGKQSSAAAAAEAAIEPSASPTSRSGQDRLRMQVRWPGGDGTDGDFFPEGKEADSFDIQAGPLRRQILANSNIIQGSLGGYQQLRPAMKLAFARVSRDGTDNGWIEAADEFELLMRSVGEELPKAEYERLFNQAKQMKAAFNGQRPGSVVYEQWVALMLDTVEDARDPSEKRFFGLF